MDYKDKYNKLVEAVKVLQETDPSNVGIQNWVKDNVPELRESEDERVRKELIKETKGSEVRLFETVTNDEFIAWLEKQGQKPDDNIKPKFKVGDWVIGRATNNEPRQISEITDRCYKSTYGGQYGFSFEDEMHLWTIQDAKDGDVLADEYGIYIFNSFDSSDDKLFICKCAYEYSKKTFEFGEMLCKKTDVYPASKDQRDLLFQKMHEAGYTFDFEKKELKKIEQKPAEWKQENREELTEFENAMMHIGGSFFGENAGLDPNDTDTIKEQAELLLELAPKIEWSEEDEKMFKYALDMIEWYSGKNENKSRVVSNWLKSIKDRVQPQTTWKPSKEQLYILHWLATNVLGDGIVDKKASEILYRLYDDLKKL